jgi:hypothetical protein
VRIRTALGYGLTIGSQLRQGFTSPLGLFDSLTYGSIQTIVVLILLLGGGGGYYG